MLLFWNLLLTKILDFYFGSSRNVYVLEEMYFLLILFRRKNEFDNYHFTIYIHRKKIPQLLRPIPWTPAYNRSQELELSNADI